MRQMLLSRREVHSIIDEANFKGLALDDVIRRRASRWRKWGKLFSPDRLCLATTTDKIGSYSSTAITITLASLGASATIGRQGTVVDNSSNLFDDALVTCIITTSSSTIGSSKSATAYVSGSEDGTNFEQDDGVMGAVDAAYTINSPTNLKVGTVLNCPTSSKIYIRTFSLAALYGGIMPKKWTPVVCNDTNQSLAALGNSMSYTGVVWTNG